MCSLYYSELALSGLMTGSGVGSMLSGGILGLIQNVTPSFDPTALMGSVVALSSLSIPAWYLIDRDAVARISAIPLSDFEKLEQAHVPCAGNNLQRAIRYTTTC